MNRRSAREKALQTLFQIDINKNDLTDVINHLKNEEEMNELLPILVNGVATNYQEIDEIITEHLDHWSLERIALVEKTILRMAIYEMRYLEDIPHGVSINEAVELAKKFADEKSGKFVNGILAKIKE